MNRKAQLFCAWCGPIFALLFIVGGVLIAKMIPPFLNSADPPDEFGRKVIEHLSEVRIGSLIMKMVRPSGSNMSGHGGADTPPRRHTPGELCAYVITGEAADLCHFANQARMAA
jgi:hypothetical protein